MSPHLQILLCTIPAAAAALPVVHISLQFV
jgi:hypothetical protein